MWTESLMLSLEKSWSPQWESERGNMSISHHFLAVLLSHAAFCMDTQSILTFIQVPCPPPLFTWQPQTVHFSLSPFSSSKSRVARLIKSAAVGRYFHIQAAKKGNADEAPAAIHRVQVSADAAAAAAANGWVPDNSPALCWWTSALVSLPPCLR